MADRKAVIKNADMAEDMQYDFSANRFRTRSFGFLSNYFFRILWVDFTFFTIQFHFVVTGRTPSTALPRPSKSTTSRRTSPPSSRRNSTKSTTPPGTPSWAATSAPTWPMKPSISSISTSVRYGFHNFLNISRFVKKNNLLEFKTFLNLSLWSSLTFCKNLKQVAILLFKSG